MADRVNLRDAVLFVVRDYQDFVNFPNNFARDQAVRAVQDIVCRLLVAVANDRVADPAVVVEVRSETAVEVRPERSP